MNSSISMLALAALAVAGALCAGGSPALAQVAGGSTTVGVSITESTRLALGWSVKKTLLGKPIYNDAGVKVGKVEDLIIAPDKNLSFVIVGAGGFIGIGRHDVAIPIVQIQDIAGKLVMTGATKDTLAQLPSFTYATDSARREQFFAAADKDIAQGKAKVVELEKSVGVAASDAKARINLEISALQAEVKTTEGKLGEMKQAAAARWKEFEAGVSAATARLRKSIATATG